MRKVLIDKKIDEINQKSYSELIDLLDSYSVNVYHKSLEELGHEYSVSIDNNILIREDLDSLQEKFILLHELGHILFHESKANFFMPNCYRFREEQEANYFAIKMLSEYIDPDMDMYSLEDLGIPMKVLNDLKDMGLM